MKQSSLGTKLFMVILTLGVLTYFGIQGYRYFSDPLTTTMAYAYEVEEGVELSGYVVRREQVLTDDTGGLLRLQRSEGQRVSVGGNVATVYADQASLDRQNEIQSLQSRIEQLQYAQAASLDSEASLKLDSQITQTILDYRRGLASGRMQEAEKQGSELRSLILKRDYTYSDTQDLTGQIEALKAEVKTLQSQSEGSVRRVNSPVSGLYSAVVDGYETVLTPEALAEMTPSQLKAVKKDSAVASKVGKVILGDYWYYVAAMKTEEAEMLSEAESLALQFAKSVERELEVTVESIGPEENGKVVVVLRGSSYLQELTLLRAQSAKIVCKTYSGIRVPKEALRAAHTLQNEDGTYTTNDKLGLYCIVGMEARFKPVEVLYNGDGFILVQSLESNSESRRLRSGDTVIISAGDLFDGKVISTTD